MERTFFLWNKIRDLYLARAKFGGTSIQMSMDAPYFAVTSLGSRGILGLMPTAPAQNKGTVQLAFRIPEEWLYQADRVAEFLVRPGLEITRTDAMRIALARGLEAFLKEMGDPPKKRGRPKKSDGVTDESEVPTKSPVTRKK